MRLLFIDVNARYHNPTNSLIPALLQLSADTVCYGPGFVEESDLTGGLARFIEKHGGFDFYVTARLDMEFTEYDISFFHRYLYPDYSSSTLKAFSSDVVAFFGQSTVPRIVFLTAVDTYALPDKYAKIIAELDGYFFAWAEGFTRPLNELDFDVFSREEFFARYKKLGRDFERWHKITTQYRHKFINLGHFVADTEFAWTPLYSRRDKVVVPGQMYVRREAARRTLAGQKELARSGQFRFALSLMDHAGLRPHARPLLQLLYNQTFVQQLASTRYAYTDGAGDDYPVRKYFEIPALGTLLLCEPCAGFEKLGFVDRKNAVVVTPSNIGTVVEWLRKSPIEAQAIADAGRKLIWNRHSLHARAEQLARALSSIAAGQFSGSRWDKGEFVVEENAKKLAAKNAPFHSKN
jgi:hypothetical protein